MHLDELKEYAERALHEFGIPDPVTVIPKKGSITDPPVELIKELGTYCLFVTNSLVRPDILAGIIEHDACWQHLLNDKTLSPVKILPEIEEANAFVTQIQDAYDEYHIAQLHKTVFPHFLTYHAWNLEDRWQSIKELCALPIPDVNREIGLYSMLPLALRHKISGQSNIFHTWIHEFAEVLARPFETVAQHDSDNRQVEISYLLSNITTYLYYNADMIQSYEDEQFRTRERQVTLHGDVPYKQTLDTVFEQLDIGLALLTTELEV